MNKKKCLFIVFKDEVKQVFDKVCTKLPTSIKDTCDEFINTYGDAIVAILVQEIDRSKS